MTKKDQRREYQRLREVRNRKKNPEVVKVRSARYYRKHAKAIKVRQARWREKNREYLKQYYQKPSTKLRVRKYHLRCKYGITWEQYQTLRRSQRGRCALCYKPFGRGGQRVHVDHDHKTGKVRALLHNNCNLILGLAHEDAELLQSAVRYAHKILCRCGEENQ